MHTIRELSHMFFVITPPDATVERAWQRGLKFGRYKAVDDLLDHNVEAFTGMPNLSFTWALRTRKLTGIVEADETCVPESRKGARNLERNARRRGGKASKRGLSDEQVPVLVVADRSGATVSAVLPAVNADALREVIAPVVDEDIVLVIDGHRACPRCAAAIGAHHEALNCHEVNGCEVPFTFRRSTTDTAG